MAVCRDLTGYPLGVDNCGITTTALFWFDTISIESLSKTSKLDCFVRTGPVSELTVRTLSAHGNIFIERDLVLAFVRSSSSCWVEGTLLLRETGGTSGGESISLGAVVPISMESSCSGASGLGSFTLSVF